MLPALHRGAARRHRQPRDRRPRARRSSCRPPQVVRFDGDDPYLVVAADKGTAAFSDIANEIAVERGFWLGDAFASGGSAGYDHKEMGITARGAWESVRRHFRHLGDRSRCATTSPSSASATCRATCSATACCCRTTSGSSPRSTTATCSSTRIPIPKRSWQERKRLFELPRSSWADYDATLDLGRRRRVPAHREVDRRSPTRCAPCSASTRRSTSCTPGELIKRDAAARPSTCSTTAASAPT